jgi:hypothetical protein
MAPAARSPAWLAALGLRVAPAQPFGLLWGTAVAYVGCIGLMMPVTTAITLEPLGRVAGFTSSVLGTVQITVATFASVLVALRYDGTAHALTELVLGASLLAVLVAVAGRRHLRPASAAGAP